MVQQNIVQAVQKYSQQLFRYASPKIRANARCQGYSKAQKKDKPLIVFDDQEEDTLSFGGRSNDWA